MSMGFHRQTDDIVARRLRRRRAVRQSAAFHREGGNKEITRPLPGDVPAGFGIYAHFARAFGSPAGS